MTTPGDSPRADLKRYQRRSCPICLEGFTAENPSLLYSCGHSYHFQCAESWLARSTRCPVCDREIRSEDAQVDDDCKPVKQKRIHEPMCASTMAHSTRSLASTDTSPSSTLAATTRKPTKTVSWDSDDEDANCEHHTLLAEGAPLSSAGGAGVAVSQTSQPAVEAAEVENSVDGTLGSAGSREAAPGSAARRGRLAKTWHRLVGCCYGWM
jgi:hypothetical protein